MCSINSGESIFLKESFANILSKDISRSSGRNTKSKLALLRITPHEISKRSLMGYFLNSKYLVNVFYLMECGWKASVYTKHLPIYDSSDGKIVKYISKKLPNFGITILCLALSVEPIYLCDLPGLVISSDQGNSLWVSKLQEHQKSYGLHAMSTTIDIVAQE